jgi:hypothetical protein
MWTADDVRIRYIEAADTERHLPRPFTATGAGYWPQHLYDEADRAGWDEAAKADNDSRPASRAPAAAISRHAQCMEWTAERIHDPMRRQLVWGYAFCRANKRDFGKLCQRRGWAKRTAYDRLHRLWDRLAGELLNTNTMFAPASDFWLAQETPVLAHTQCKMAPDIAAPLAIPFAPSFITEKSTDLIRSAEDAESFARFLQASNSAGRAEQDRRESRRRQKLGLMVSPA